LRRFEGDVEMSSLMHILLPRSLMDDEVVQLGPGGDDFLDLESNANSSGGKSDVVDEKKKQAPTVKRRLSSSSSHQTSAKVPKRDGAKKSSRKAKPSSTKVTKGDKAKASKTSRGKKRPSAGGQAYNTEWNLFAQWVRVASLCDEYLSPSALIVAGHCPQSRHGRPARLYEVFECRLERTKVEQKRI
jgi:hypothetical protein